MAFQYLNLVLLCIFFTDYTTGHRLVLRFGPSEVIHGLTRRLDLTCSLYQDTSANYELPRDENSEWPNITDISHSHFISPDDIHTVVSVFINKHSYMNETIATVSSFNPATATLNLNKSEATGYVNASLDPKAYLQVSWSHPDNEQEGNYSCVIHSIDALGRTVSFEEFMQVPVREPTPGEIVKHTWNLESRQIQQRKYAEKRLENQEKQIQQLFQLNRKLTEKTQRLAFQLIAQDAMMSSWMKQMEERKNKMQDLETKLQNRLLDQREILQMHSKISNRQGVGFTAQLTTQGNRLSTGPEGLLKFTKILTNIGEHYNPSTGEFTAPENGTYMGFVSLRQFGTSHVTVTIYHRDANNFNNKKTVCTTKTSSDETSSSCVGVAQMAERDILFVEKVDVGGSTSLSVLSTFTCSSLS